MDNKVQEFINTKEQIEKLQERKNYLAGQLKVFKEEMDKILKEFGVKSPEELKELYNLKLKEVEELNKRAKEEVDRLTPKYNELETFLMSN